jgi:hypothetical protein
MRQAQHSEGRIDANKILRDCNLTFALPQKAQKYIGTSAV